jgi:hypothetical protein
VTAAEQVGAELALTVRVFGLGTDLMPVDEDIDDLLRRYGLDPSGALLIRPDGFVGFRSINAADDEQKSLSSALRQILDLS